MWLMNIAHKGINTSILAVSFCIIGLVFCEDVFKPLVYFVKFYLKVGNLFHEVTWPGAFSL